MKNNKGERLVRLRVGLGFSQRELAREFCVSSGAIGFWESGGREIPGSIIKLMEVYEHHLHPRKPRSALTELNQLSDLLSAKIIETVPAQGRSPRAESIRDELRQIVRKYLGQHLSNDPIQRRVQLATYSKLVNNLGKTRGLPLKILQLISFLDPEVSEQLRSLITSLQGEMACLSKVNVFRILREELGVPADLFTEWSAQPIAVASLGQVHKACLHSGESVAVKVQFPHAYEDLESAFAMPIVQDLLAMLIRANSTEILNDFKARVLRECNYHIEAETQQKFGAAFAKDPDIIVPSVHKKFCSPRVLTTEFIEGRSFYEFANTASQSERNRAAEAVVRFQAISFFMNNSLYADCHPGNIIFTENKIAILDYGRAFSAEEAFSTLGRLMVAILDNDPVRGRAAVEESKMISDWTDFDFDEFWNLLREQHMHFWENEPFAFNASYLARKNQALKTFKQHHSLQLNGPAFWNFFVVSTHDAVRAQLNAKANWRRVVLSVIKKSKFGNLLESAE